MGDGDAFDALLDRMGGDGWMGMLNRWVRVGWTGWAGWDGWG